jgi:hypothetical protein
MHSDHKRLHGSEEVRGQDNCISQAGQFQRRLHATMGVAQLQQGRMLKNGRRGAATGRKAGHDEIGRQRPAEPIALATPFRPRCLPAPTRLFLIVDRSRVGPSGRRNPQARKLCKPQASRRTRRTTWIRRRRPQGPHIDRRRIAYDPVRHRRTRAGFDPMQHRLPMRTAATPAKTSSTRRRLGTPPRRRPASRLGRLRSPTVSAVFTAQLLDSFQSVQQKAVPSGAHSRDSCGFCRGPLCGPGLWFASRSRCERAT